VIVDTIQQFEEFVARLTGQPEVTLDIESTGVDLWGVSEMCGVGFGFGDGTWYLPYRHQTWDPDTQPLFAAFMPADTQARNLPLSTLTELWEALATVGRIKGHNIKFDMTGLVKDGYEPPDTQEFEDTLCGARLYFPGDEDSLSLESCVRHVLGEDESAWKREFTEYRAQRGIKNFARVEVPVLAAYCEKDVENTGKLAIKFRAHAEKTEQAAVYEQERHVIRTFFDMEVDGLRIDKGYIPLAKEQTLDGMSALDGEIRALLGFSINPGSSHDVTRAMAHVGQPAIKLTPGGQASWDQDALGRVDSTLSQLILAWRALSKMIDTFFDPYMAMPGEFIHPNFKSWVPVTGRVSVDDPNLQQVSRVVDWESDHPLLWQLMPGFDVQVRRMFIAPDDFEFVCWDYSQMEMLVYASYLNDPALTERLNSAGSVDFHSLVASMIWKVDPVEEGHERYAQFKAYRAKAKAISLGLVYMMGIARLADALGCDEDSAKAFKQTYFKQFPTAESFIWKVRQKVQMTARSSPDGLGRVHNRFGRLYALPIEWDYKAINYLVQGSSADLVKRAMVRLHRELRSRGMRSRLAFQMHDEFGSYIHKSEWDDAVPLFPQVMEDNPDFCVRLPVDGSLCAPDWSKKVKLCKTCFKVKGECKC
jgi:DNA polymerase-1